MTRLMLLPLLLVAGSSAGAQEGAPAEAPAVLRISLSDAVARAQASSARLAEARSLEDAASAGLRGAEAGRMPQVDLSASYTRNSEIPELTFAFPGSGPQTLFPSIPNNYRAHAGVALPLYTGGRVGAAIESAREGLAAAGKDRERAAADVVLDTTVAYWSLVRARAEARVLADAVSSFEAHLKDATNREALGMAARNEVLAVQVERDEAELSRLGADGDAEVAEANLARILDLAPGTPIEPTEPLASQGVEGDLETLVERAAADRPEVAALRSRAAALEA
ncbi:MAG TPA: TolC family protein, partial [Vicinamibacteria bacterium]